MGQKIIHDKHPFRGSEVNQLDISMMVKDWIIKKLIFISPSLPLIIGYFLYKWIMFTIAMSSDKYIENFAFFNKTFYVIAFIGLVLVLMFGKKLEKIWIDKEIEAHKQLVSDEYIRGSKLICVDDFNKQFDGNEDMLFFEIEDEACNRKF